MSQRLPVRAQAAAALLLTLLAGAACATPLAVALAAAESTVPAVGADALREQLQAELERAFPANEPGATALVMQDGKVLFRGAAGMANLELGVAMRPEMVLRLGSVTKQFTAVCILMLVEQGKLAFDDEITKFLPDFPVHGQKITIERLLTHTSGVKNYTELPAFWDQQRQDKTLLQLIDMFKQAPPEFAPGERFVYSNSGYVLLGAVIEKVSGQTYAAFVQQHIFAVLGMAHTRYDSTASIIPGRVPGYKHTAQGYDNGDYFSMSLPYAAGSLVSTVDDLAKWDEALYTEKLVSQASLLRAWTTFHLDDGRPTHYGYGWAITDIAGIPMLNHGGGVNGFNSMLVRVPQTHVFAVVLSNRDGGEAWLARKLAALASGRKWTEPVAVPVSAAALDLLVGKYQLPQQPDIEVAHVKDGLSIHLQRYGTVELRPLSDTEFFFVLDPLARVTFLKDNTGQPLSLQLRTNRGPDEVAIKTDKPQ